jgi:hypothetical protein
MTHRGWDQPFFSETYVPTPSTQADVPDDVWADQAQDYVRTLHTTS